MIKLEYEVMEPVIAPTHVGVHVKYWIDGNYKGIHQFSMNPESFYAGEWESMVENWAKKIKEELEKNHDAEMAKFNGKFNVKKEFKNIKT